jgi:hypothetical protein
VLDIHLLMVKLGGQALSGLQRFERFFGEAVLVHVRAPLLRQDIAERIK